MFIDPKHASPTGEPIEWDDFDRELEQKIREDLDLLRLRNTIDRYEAREVDLVRVTI